jgi:rhomboid protease GluP
MNIGTLMVWMVSASCLSLVVRSLQVPRRYRDKGWLIVSVSILMILVLASVMLPNWSAWIGGGLWLGLIAIPLVGMAQVRRWVQEEQFRSAWRLSILLRWLHPADGWREQPTFLKALYLGHQGDLDSALQLLRHLPTGNRSMNQTAIALLYQLQARWDALLENLQPAFSNPADAEPWLIPYYLRALGETGNLKSLVWTAKQAIPRFEKIGDRLRIHFIQLFVFAFGGHQAGVEYLLNHQFVKFPSSTKQFWMATVYSTAGDRATAEQLLEALEVQGHSTLQQAIAWRRSHPLAMGHDLSPDERAILDDLYVALQQDARYGGQFAQAQGRCWVTYGLIGLNVLMFALATGLGGNENLETLYRLGALVPDVVVQGEWWRIAAACFLHLGWLHLTMNMLGLYVLGRFVETHFGMKRYLAGYLICGLGSMLAVTWISLQGYSQATFVVGASGAIMGLVGMLGAIFFQGWRQEKAAIAAKRFRLILFMVALQTLFDLTTPGISFVGHISGVMIGFGVGMFLTKWPQQPSR